MPETYCVILSTAGSKDEAQRLADLLVQSGLAACVQIAPIDSTYVWQGKVTRESEHLLLIKTTADRYPDIESAIVANHSYEIPEIVQLTIERGLDRYLKWIGASTEPSAGADSGS